MQLNEVEPRIIFLTTVGSYAYGINTEASDEDEAGVMIPSVDHYLTLQRFEQFQGYSTDKTIYDFLKALSLLKDNNPNMLDLLYTDKKFFKIITPYWEKVIENRHLFLSSKVYHTFSGYAFAQLKRVDRHRKWFLNPIEKPKRSDYGLSESDGIPQAQVNALSSLPAEFFSEEYRKMISAEKEYYFAKKNWDNYKEWESKRNKERAVTEKKFGFDTKHGGHLFRLMSMAEEILSTGEVNVSRQGIDSDVILAIRNGEWTYEKIMEWADKKNARLEELYKTTKLPYTPNIKGINELAKEILLQFFKDKGEI